MKNKTEKVGKESKEDVKSLLLHLENEYRKANISEKHYKELKEKYQKMLGESKVEKKKEVKKITQREKPKIEETVEKEEEPEEVEGDLGRVEEKAEKEITQEKTVTEKKGFLKSLFGKKKEAEVQPEEDSPKSEDPPKSAKKEKKEEEITEITPEVIERLAQQAKEEAEGKTEESADSGEKKSGGFLKSIFGKKEKQENKEPQEQVQEQPQSQHQPVNETTEYPQERYKPSGTDYVVEIEKLKVMIDTIRESGKLTDESVRNLSESIGEIRSMVFQTDAELKEDSVKMEKVEDDISEVKPEEIAKKLREIDETFGKQQLELEKLGRKAEDSGEKINRVFEILKSIGGIENLVNINTDIQKKLDDINEAMKYVERIGMKTEKMFIDLNKGLQDLVIIRSQQDDFNESLKDIIKNIDSVNVKFEGYITKKDLDSIKEDNMLIKKDVEDVKKVLPIVELKLPENIIDLRKEREDIKMLLDSLDEQRIAGKIARDEYENIKSANMKRLEEIGITLEKEWKNVEDLIKPAKGGAEGVEEEIEKKPEKIEEDIEEEKSKEVRKKPKKVEEPKEVEENAEEETPEEMEEVEEEHTEKEEEPEEVEEDLGRVEEKAEKEITQEKTVTEKKGFLKSLFGKKKEAEVQPEEVKKETEVVEKEVPQPKEVKREVKPKEGKIKPRKVKTKKVKKKIKAKPRKAKATKKKVVKRKPVKKIIQSEKSRKLQILKDIKRMH